MGTYDIAILSSQSFANKNTSLMTHTDASVAVLLLDARHVLSSGLAGKAPNASGRPLSEFFSACSMEYIMAPGMFQSLKRRRALLAAPSRG